MSARSLTTRLAKVEEQLAVQGLHDEDDDRPPMPLFLRVAFRDAHRRLTARGELRENEDEGTLLARLVQELSTETHDQLLVWLDLGSVGDWLDDGLGHIDENTLPEDADAIVAEMYQQRKLPLPASTPAATKTMPAEPLSEYGLKELPPPPDEPTPAAVVPAAQPEPAPPRHVLTFPLPPPTRGVAGLPERDWKPFRWSTFC
jgi:hypothetical protein